MRAAAEVAAAGVAAAEGVDVPRAGLAAAEVEDFVAAVAALGLQPEELLRWRVRRTNGRREEEERGDLAARADLL